MPKRRTPPPTGAGTRTAPATAAGGPPPEQVADLVQGPFELEVAAPDAARPRRLQISFTQPRRALVRDESGHVYDTALESCTCWDFVANGACHHVEAVRRALGLAPGAAGEPAAVRGDADGLADARALWERHERQAEARRQDAERRAEAAREDDAEAVALRQDRAAFERLWALAQDDRSVRYERHNVLNGSTNTFGVEIEFVGGDAAAIARDLHAAGLIERPARVPYHSPRRPGMWSFERDGSVSGENSGGEVVSPVLSDDPRCWEQIERVCEIVRRHGGYVDHRCGAHVHVSNESLDTRTWRWQRLARLVAGYEDVLFRMAAAGPAHRGQSTRYNYAQPMDAGGFPRGARRQDIDQLRRSVSPSRYAALNLTNPHTVEFRHFDGTLDPRRIQANVMVASAIVDAARRMTRRRDPDGLVPARPMPLGQGARQGDPEHLGVRRLLDALFSRARDQVAALWLYASSQWQTR